MNPLSSKIDRKIKRAFNPFIAKTSLNLKPAFGSNKRQLFATKISNSYDHLGRNQALGPHRRVGNTAGRVVSVRSQGNGARSGQSVRFQLRRRRAGSRRKSRSKTILLVVVAWKGAAAGAQLAFSRGQAAGGQPPPSLKLKKHGITQNPKSKINKQRFLSELFGNKAVPLQIGRPGLGLLLAEEHFSAKKATLMTPKTQIGLSSKNSNHLLRNAKLQVFEVW